MTIITRFYQNTFTTLYHCNLHGCAFVHRHTCGSRGESAVADRRYRERCPTDESMIPRWTSTRESLMHFPVTASKSRACCEGHTSGPCRWLFSAARPVGDVESLKALHRYNVVKHPDHERNCAARFPSRSRLLLRRQTRGALRPSVRPAFRRLPPLERLDVAARRLRLPPTKYFRHR